MAQAHQDPGGGKRGSQAGGFPAGTLVQTPRGEIAVEQLRPGDEVLAGEWVDGSLTVQRRSLLATSSQRLDELFVVTARSDAGDMVTLAAGPDCSFFLPERQSDLRARALARGDGLLLANGELARVIGLARWRLAVKVFGLEVEGACSYFVGKVANGPAVLVTRRPASRVEQGFVNHLAGKAFDSIVRAHLEGIAGVVAVQNRLVVTSTRVLLRQGPVDIEFDYGVPGNLPLAGDWNGDGVDTVGVRRGDTWFLRNSNSTGVADIQFPYGLAEDIAVGRRDHRCQARDEICGARGPSCPPRRSASSPAPETRNEFRGYGTRTS